jgi:hypothetical protein
MQPQRAAPRKCLPLPRPSTASPQIDALKLNDIDIIFGLPGIPITDLTRMAQTGACA